MVTEIEFKDIVKKTRSDGLVISRIPKTTRDEFLDFADKEFAGDYGMTLRHLWDTFKLWNIFIGSFDYKLNHIISKLENRENNPMGAKGIKTLSGNKLAGG